MRVIEKVNFEAFNWLNFESLPDSNGFKFELYPKTEGTIDGLMLVFYDLFGRLKNDLVIGQFGIDSRWGDFCIDTWDIENDRYDYSPGDKSESTSNYLRMLAENEVNAEYTGFVKCRDWDKFLPVILDCVLSHTAPYSVMVYAPDHELVFYFHHTGSLGVYYKELNNEVRCVLQKAKEEDMEIVNYTDGSLKFYFYEM
ncbi:MAG: hypothetical protein ACOYXT_29875 [Bacteroidota bacterium]